MVYIVGTSYFERGGAGYRDADIEDRNARTISCDFMDHLPDGWLQHSREGYMPASILKPIEIVGRSRMPDIYKFACEGDLLVSSKFRAAVERYAPGQCEFLPMIVSIPPHMEPDTAYYYLNIINRQSFLDWGAPTKKGPRQKDGREWIIFSYDGYPAVFRAEADAACNIWREKAIETPTATYFHPPSYRYMSDPLWQALDEAFPKQLSRRRRY